MNEMGTSVYDSPEEIKTNLEIKHPFKITFKEFDIIDEEKDRSKDRVMIHVEVGGDLVHNEIYSPKVLSPMKSSMNNTPRTN